MTGKERGVYAASSLANRWANRFVQDMAAIREIYRMKTHADVLRDRS